MRGKVIVVWGKVHAVMALNKIAKNYFYSFKMLQKAQPTAIMSLNSITNMI
jgi:hypothetical protein